MILLIIIGFLAGVVSGMGIGGGVILIPGLIIVVGMEQHSAQSICLLYFIPTAIVALIQHFKNKNIRTDLIIGLIPGGVIGAIIGSFVAINIESNNLKRYFGYFLLLMGILELNKARKLMHKK